MSRKGFSPIVIILILAIVVLAVGVFWYLGHNLAGGGGSDQIAPASVSAGQPAIVKIDLDVWGGGGPVAGRYTDLNFYYRLVGQPTYNVLQSSAVPIVYTGAQAKFNGDYEEYTFTIPPYPTNTSGSIEFYYDVKLDGVQNHALGLKTIQVIPVTK
jgi:hypothetical protein